MCAGAPPLPLRMFSRPEQDSARLSLGAGGSDRILLFRATAVFRGEPKLAAPVVDMEVSSPTTGTGEFSVEKGDAGPNRLARCRASRLAAIILAAGEAGLTIAAGPGLSPGPLLPKRPLLA